MLAERTGLEPATPGVTGRYSNQLNYRSVYSDRFFRDKTSETLVGGDKAPGLASPPTLPI